MIFDWFDERAALALTWGFWIAAAILGGSAYRARGRALKALRAQLAGVRFESAKTQIFPEWLVSSRRTIVGGKIAGLPRFKLPAERSP